jgi:hypothetical protein
VIFEVRVILRSKASIVGAAAGSSRFSLVFCSHPFDFVDEFVMSQFD